MKQEIFKLPIGKLKVSKSWREDFSHSLFSKESLSNAYQTFTQTIEREDIGFFDISADKSIIKECVNLREGFLQVKHFVHVGIGGSSLGPEMLVNALQKNDHMKFSFFNNIDSDDIYQKLKQINPEEALFYIVSKSGGTAETLACLSLIQNWLFDLGIPEQDFPKYFVFCTDPEKGDLRKLAQEKGYHALTIPPNIGGRFSVLSAAGIFPALFAGIDPHELFAGAEEMKKEILNEDLVENILLNLSTRLFFAFKQNGINQTVLMPYSSKLRDLSFWFVQLWAESLGKKKNLKGEDIYTGLTPIPAYGATDQHSQVQLFMEGPYNKALFLIGIDPDNRPHDFSLANQHVGKGFERLAPHKLNQLLHAELQGTLKALDEAERPYFYLEWDKLNESNLGGTIILLESLTAIMGQLLQIDPFNQPGVEAGKKFSFEWLKKL